MWKLCEISWFVFEPKKVGIDCSYIPREVLAMFDVTNMVGNNEDEFCNSHCVFSDMMNEMNNYR